MLLTEYNEAEQMELFREDGRKEGLQEGLKEGLKEGLEQGVLRTLADLVKKGIISVKTAAMQANLSEDVFSAKIKSLQ